MLSTDLLISGAGLTCCVCMCVCVCVCVCLCALSLSFVYSMWGSDKQNGEMAHCISGLAANLRWMGPYGRSVSVSQTVGSLCQPVIFCGCSVSAYYTPLSCLSPAMALLSWLPSRTVLKNVCALVVSLMTISSSLNPNLVFYIFPCSLFTVQCSVLFTQAFNAFLINVALNVLITE